MYLYRITGEISLMWHRAMYKFHFNFKNHQACMVFRRRSGGHPSLTWDVRIYNFWCKIWLQCRGRHSISYRINILRVMNMSMYLISSSSAGSTMLFSILNSVVDSHGYRLQFCCVIHTCKLIDFVKWKR